MGVPGGALHVAGAVFAHLHRGGVVDVQPHHVRLAQGQGVVDVLRHGGDAGGKSRSAEVRLRPAAQTDRVQCHGVGKGPVVIRAGKGQCPGGIHIRFCLRHRVADAAGGNKTHLVFRVCTAQLLCGKAVGVDNVPPAGKLTFQRQLQTRGVLSGAVAHLYDAGRLVEGEPLVYPAFEVLCHFCSIPGKSVGGVFAAPAALFFQRLGQVPVIQGDVRFDPGFQQGIHKSIVIGKAFLVPVCAAVGGNAGPRHRKAVGVQVHGLQQRKILFPAVVAVAGNVTGLAPVGAPRCVGKNIPDAQSLAALCGTAFDLIGRRCGTPDKFFWKFSHDGSPFIVSDGHTRGRPFGAAAVYYRVIPSPPWPLRFRRALPAAEGSPLWPNH